MREELSLKVVINTDTDFASKLFSLRSGQRQQGWAAGSRRLDESSWHQLKHVFPLSAQSDLEVMLGQTVKPEVLNSPSRTNFDAFLLRFISLFPCNSRQMQAFNLDPHCCQIGSQCQFSGPWCGADKVVVPLAQCHSQKLIMILASHAV